ncbi:Sulfotransferase 1C3 [Stylophora pistillata]|uniref:Sulfotransferase 1C3 n=1 Tax=Stylophora pistillata TaxID=50429 RepID=A0A2B4RF16_STYPI|nr:Sulfotransferase 1C3 [Stylophora pistillata]
MVVGLGNHSLPDTRHSVGMLVVDCLAKYLGTSWHFNKQSLVTIYNVNPSDVILFHDDLDRPLVTHGLQFDHVLGWWKQRDDPNILILTYEDRVQDPGDAVDKIAKFIGKEISPATRDLIVRQTSFDAMKSSNYTNFTWFEGIKGDGFIRKGQVGGWKDYFTEEQNELFDKVFSERSLRRVRVGIGRPSKRNNVTEYVLSNFDPSEIPVLERTIEQCCEVLMKELQLLRS